MTKCNRCGKVIDRAIEKDEFEMDFFDKSYDCFSETLCSECASEVIQNEETGIYYEYCEKCNRKFDYFEDKLNFLNSHSYDSGAEDFYCWNHILCEDCADEEYDHQIASANV